MAYWLLKSDPETYSFERMKKEKKTFWDGVHNYAARNHLRNVARVIDRPRGVIGGACRKNHWRGRGCGGNREGDRVTAAGIHSHRAALR